MVNLKKIVGVIIVTVIIIIGVIIGSIILGKNMLTDSPKSPETLADWPVYDTEELLDSADLVIQAKVRSY